MAVVPQRVERDELLPFDPEPCPSCPTGLRYMLCYDGVWRCQVCMGELARRMNWDELGEADQVSQPISGVSDAETDGLSAPSARQEPSPQGAFDLSS